MGGFFSKMFELVGIDPTLGGLIIGIPALIFLIYYYSKNK
jgi:hypothetical protein